MIESHTVETYPRWRCPCCEAIPEGKFETVDRDTLGLGPTAESKRLHSLFWTLHCPACAGTSYIVELDVLSDPVPEKQFVADNCWRTERRTKSLLCSGDLSWEHDLEEGIIFDDGGQAEWIGRHFLGPFQDFNEARRVGAEIAAVVLEWRPTERQRC